MHFRSAREYLKGNQPIRAAHVCTTREIFKCSVSFTKHWKVCLSPRLRLLRNIKMHVDGHRHSKQQNICHFCTSKDRRVFLVLDVCRHFHFASIYIIIPCREPACTCISTMIILGNQLQLLATTTVANICWLFTLEMGLGTKASTLFISNDIYNLSFVIYRCRFADAVYCLSEFRLCNSSELYYERRQRHVSSHDSIGCLFYYPSYEHSIIRSDWEIEKLRNAGTM